MYVANGTSKMTVNELTVIIRSNVCHIHTYISTYVHTYIHTYVRTYIYTYTYIHTYIHIYTCYTSKMTVSQLT
jgi:hypothetical protein